MEIDRTNKKNEGEIVIRDLSPPETEEVYEMGRNEPYFCGFWDREVIEAIPNSNDCYALTARVDDALAGFAIAQYSPTLRKATWENLYVSLEHRKRVYDGTSVSRALSEAIIRKMQSVGATSINGMTETKNSQMRRLFEKLDFEEIGEFVWERKGL
ncbi:MAG: GNAT family N-acetyltransferase [Nanoarchaeota archaeon]|nr:GNAT family N-acetyltransferase [Nanoarchaeota archaeon]